MRTASLLSRQPNNVCFYFLRTRQRLWANEGVIRRASPYFETLFTSGFAETSEASKLNHASDVEELPPYEFEDSDAELDETVDPEKKPRDEGYDVFPFKTIRITDTSFTTYFAVLIWISTGYISFALLTSCFSLSSSSTTRAEERRPAIAAPGKESSPHGSLPVASPKSVYRLAHLLELSELKDLALNAYKSRLAPSGALAELYSDVACAYPEVRAIAMKFFVAHWKAIRTFPTFERVENKLENQEPNSATALIGLKLATKLMETYGPK